MIPDVNSISVSTERVWHARVQQTHVPHATQRRRSLSCSRISPAALAFCMPLAAARLSCVASACHIALPRALSPLATVARRRECPIWHRPHKRCVPLALSPRQPTRILSLGTSRARPSTLPPSMPAEARLRPSPAEPRAWLCSAARSRTASICATVLHHPSTAPHMASMNARPA